MRTIQHIPLHGTKFNWQQIFAIVAMQRGVSFIFVAQPSFEIFNVEIIDVHTGYIFVNSVQTGTMLQLSDVMVSVNGCQSD